MTAVVILAVLDAVLVPAAAGLGWRHARRGQARPYALILIFTGTIMLSATQTETSRDRGLILLAALLVGAIVVLIIDLNRRSLERFSGAFGKSGEQLPSEDKADVMPIARPLKSHSDEGPARAGAVGTNAIVTLLSDRIRITGAGVSSYLIHGPGREDELPLEAIAGVFMKKPAFLRNGYIRFRRVGEEGVDDSLIDPLNDERVVFFDRRHQAEFERLRDIVVADIRNA